MLAMVQKKIAVSASLVLTTALVGVMVSGFTAQKVQAAAQSVTLPFSQVSEIDPAQWTAGTVLDEGVLFEGLAAYNQKNQVVPAIASHWTVTDGGKVWTFYLRPNVKWSNGQPVTAQDFYYAWMRTASPTYTTSALWASPMNFVKNAWLYHGGGCSANQVGLKVINSHELQVTEASPHDIVGWLPIAGAMPLYPPSVESHPNNWFTPKYFVGDGPYRLKSFVVNGEIKLVRNSNYTRLPGIFLGNVQQFNLLPTPTVPLEDYLSNKLDAAQIVLPSDYHYVQTHSSLKSQLHVSPTSELQYLGWDKAPEPSPLDKLQVRQAIAMAVNRTPIVTSVLNGMAEPTFVYGFPGWPPTKYEHGLPFNVKAAQNLLAKAGYPHGKGVPQLYLYVQAATTSMINTAEAVAEELHQNLGLNFKIEPLASAIYGDLTYGGITPGVKPGYMIGTGLANWKDVTGELQMYLYWEYPGAIGPSSYREFIAKNWYDTAYDPQDVALWGNPNNSKMGITLSQWKPLMRSAESDISYLNAWIAKQPPAYRTLLTEPGTPTYQQSWDNYVNAWKKAKTPVQKHAAWVAAWEFIGTYSTGTASVSTGLQGDVYLDQHEPRSVYLQTMWNSEAEAAVSVKSGAQLAAKISNLMMQQGYAVPLYYDPGFYLEKPDLTGVQFNPWAFGGFYQLQYISIK